VVLKVWQNFPIIFHSFQIFTLNIYIPRELSSQRENFSPKKMLVLGLNQGL
jgi:hypothetical protein